jgi:deazaflavin-dependent oxidoreductase (nitroreductase family)
MPEPEQTGGSGRSVMPRWLPALNKRVINPIQRLWAPYLPPEALILHRGRKSGAEYRTPVVAFRTDHGFAILLIYGHTQWVRNVLAAQSADMKRAGKRFRLVNPRVLKAGTSADLPRILRRPARKIDVLLVDVA